MQRNSCAKNPRHPILQEAVTFELLGVSAKATGLLRHRHVVLRRLQQAGPHERSNGWRQGFPGCAPGARSLVRALREVSVAGQARLHESRDLGAKTIFKVKDSKYDI